MPVEVQVANPAYWFERAPQLAQILGGAAAAAPSTIGDPTGKPPDPQAIFRIADPAYWSAQLAGLREALALASDPAAFDPARAPSSSAAAAGPAANRLTMSVEEAAAALGISRAFAYDAVARKEIPHIRIGRRILVPRAALHRLLEGEPSGDKQDPGSKSIESGS
jgi:excisionase family DNA binding protein